MKNTGVARGTDESDDEGEQNRDNERADKLGEKAKHEKWGKVFTGVVDIDVDQSVILESFLDYSHVCAYGDPLHAVFAFSDRTSP